MVTMMQEMVSIVVPIYGRGRFLTDSLHGLFTQTLSAPGVQMLCVDQTPEHSTETEAELRAWKDAGAIRWIRLFEPSVTHAMNVGLREATSPVVLFLDDDIVPSPGLVEEHVRAHREHPDAWAVLGQVLRSQEWKGCGKCNVTADLSMQCRYSESEPSDHVSNHE